MVGRVLPTIALPKHVVMQNSKYQVSQDLRIKKHMVVFFYNIDQKLIK